MKRIRLQQKEYNTISNIVEEYRSIERDLTKVQEELEKLDREKTSLLEKLESTRKRENSFFQGVKKKHGEGKLDLLTMDYVTK